jgi:hypothetical protein
VIALTPVDSDGLGSVCSSDLLLVDSCALHLLLHPSLNFSHLVHQLELLPALPTMPCCRYDIGGYQLPFLLGAGLAFIDVLVVALLMDDSVAVAVSAPIPLDDDNDFSWRDMLKHR